MDACSMGGEHVTSKRVHTNEDGSHDIITSCDKCGMEW